MSVLKLIVPNADFSGTGLGKFFSLPDIRSSLYAAYLPGSDFGAGAGAKDVSGHGRDATMTANKGVARCPITTGGTAYTTAAVAFSGGGGTGAAATAVLTGGVITAINVTNSGSLYTSAPTVTITGDGTGAAATSVISGQLAKGFQGGGSDFIELPFTGADVVLANAEATFVAIAKMPKNDGQMLLSNFGTSNTTFVGVLGGKVDATGVNSYNYGTGGTGSGNANATLDTTGAGRGTNVEMYAGSITATSSMAYRGSTSLGSANASVTRGTGHSMGGTGKMRAGDIKTGDANWIYSAPLIHALLVYNKALTAVELDSVRTDMKALLATYSVAL
jgi:hypothetical protein